MRPVIGFLTPFKTILHFSQPPSPLFRLCAIFQDVTPTNQTSCKSGAYIQPAACFGYAGKEKSTKAQRIIVRFWCFQQVPRASVSPALKTVHRTVFALPGARRAVVLFDSSYGSTKKTPQPKLGSIFW